MFEISYATDVGSTHQKNDDRVLVDTEIHCKGHGTIKSENIFIAAIFDGVGGEAFGFEAAELAANYFKNISKEELTINSIRHYFCKANELILASQQQDFEHRNMSTTVAGVVVSEYDIMAFNVGDSRIYRYRKPYLAQLSEDHTLKQQMKELCLDDSKSPEHVITRYLGGNVYEPYVFDGTDRNFDEDVYLLCSDGISDVVNDEEFAKILSKEESSEEMCLELIHKALSNGSEDNLSIIIIRRA